MCFTLASSSLVNIKKITSKNGHFSRKKPQITQKENYFTFQSRQTCQPGDEAIYVSTLASGNIVHVIPLLEVIMYEVCEWCSFQ